MKKHILYIILLFIVSCKRSEIPTYSGTSGIYFETSREVAPGTFWLTDTSIISFAYTPAKVDSFYALLIKVKGDTVNRDRQFKIKVIDTAANSAKPDIHYAKIPETGVVPAGKASMYLVVKLLKHPDMQSKTMAINLQLQENENFKTDLPKLFLKEQNRYINAISHTLLVDDLLSRPKYWLDGYLGNFSRKKYLLLCKILDIPVVTLNNSTPVGTIKYYGSFMRTYLNDEAAAGRIVYEDDGTVMKMGDGL